MESEIKVIMEKLTKIMEAHPEFGADITLSNGENSLNHLISPKWSCFQLQRLTNEGCIFKFDINNPEEIILRTGRFVQDLYFHAFNLVKPLGEMIHQMKEKSVIGDEKIVPSQEDTYLH